LSDAGGVDCVSGGLKGGAYLFSLILGLLQGKLVVDELVESNDRANHCTARPIAVRRRLTDPLQKWLWLSPASPNSDSHVTKKSIHGGQQWTSEREYASAVPTGRGGAV